MNVYRALVYFRPGDFQGTSHVTFRQMLAHVLLTLGKVPFGEEPPDETGTGAAAGNESTLCNLETFKAYKNEKHRCGYCTFGAYYYCKTCFPDVSQVRYGICAPGSTGRACFAKHVLGHETRHQCEAHSRESPRLAKKRAAREERATSGAGRPAARRRVQDDLSDDE